MSNLPSRTVTVLCLLCAAVAAQAPDGGSHAAPLKLVYATFDPGLGEPAVPLALRSGPAERLWIVQFAGLPTEASRAAVRGTGAEIHGYLPDHAYVVRMDGATAAAVRRLDTVRWTGPYHPAYRLEPALVAAVTADEELPAQRYNIVVVDKRADKPALGAAILAMGGLIDDEQEGSLLFTVTLTAGQLLQAARLDQVLWIDRWTPVGEDMDNARIQGGGNHVETQGGYTGTGVGAHIYEGIEATHADFTGGATNVRSGGGADDHGHATAGIVFGNGNSNPAVRGMAPDATKFFTQYGSVSGSRYQVVLDLVNIHDVSHTTASWGNTQTTSYTSVSAEADDIIFDHDIAWTQSQSNTGNRNSRPQAWAKNIFSIGGVRHNNNSNPGDDSWQAGGASIGPAADGRIKPTLCAYYESIGTSDRTGSAGYTANSWYASFGGTSGATPIVAGHNVLAIQMFTDGIFGNTLRFPGSANRHLNRPHFTTLKALQVTSATQYPFTAASTDNRREHQGWGFPSLQRMYDYRNKTFLVDETDPLQQSQASRWLITVAPGEPDLKICMTHAEPAANPAASQQRINNLSIRVTDPNGVVYWGNNGLESGNWSVPGGAEDDVNTLECVFVQNPAPGVWSVDVKATLVAVDSHVETATTDADYGLAVSGGTGQAGPPPIFPGFLTFGQGCPGSIPVPPVCAELNGNGGSLSGVTRNWEYAYQVVNGGPLQVTGFDVFTRSTGGTQVVGAFLYASAGSGPAVTPLASTTISIGPTAAFYTATFAAPVAVGGTFYVSFDSSAQTTVLSQLTSGSGGTAFYRSPPGGSWAQSGLVTAPSYRILCSGAGFAIPSLTGQGLPALGSSYSVQLADTLPLTLAIGLMGLSDTTFPGGSLPFALPGAPGCSVQVSPDVTSWFITTPAGGATQNVTVPNLGSLVGLQLFHQWVISDAANALGLVVSNAGRATIGS